MADPEGVIRRSGSPLAFLPFRPVADGLDVPLDPMGTIGAGSAAGISLIVGTNAEEWNLFALMSAPAQNDDELRDRVGLVAPDPDAALTAYRAEHPDFDPKQIEGAVLTDVVFRVPAVRMAEAQRPHAPVFEYLFSWASPAWGGQIGASHAVEIPFVFDVTKDPRLAIFVGDSPPAELATAMHQAWIGFASDGQPGGGGLPEWPSITESERATMVLDTESRLEVNPGASTLAVWDDAVSSEGELAARPA
jgi:para-nitrobenzyl esterase